MKELGYFFISCGGFGDNRGKRPHGMKEWAVSFILCGGSRWRSCRKPKKLSPVCQQELFRGSCCHSRITSFCKLTHQAVSRGGKAEMRRKLSPGGAAGGSAEGPPRSAEDNFHPLARNYRVSAPAGPSTGPVGTETGGKCALCPIFRDRRSKKGGKTRPLSRILGRKEHFVVLYASMGRQRQRRAAA